MVTKYIKTKSGKVYSVKEIGNTIDFSNNKIEYYICPLSENGFISIPETFVEAKSDRVINLLHHYEAYNRNNELISIGSIEELWNVLDKEGFPVPGVIIYGYGNSVERVCRIYSKSSMRLLK